MKQSNRGETIFADALRLSAEQRSAYLDEASGGDVALRQRVEALLEGYEEAGGFLEDSAARTVPAMEKPGDMIGRYKLLQQIGEGGCGVVYLAEQEVPVRRQVALKVIKLGMDTKSVIARFDAERQALCSCPPTTSRPCRCSTINRSLSPTRRNTRASPKPGFPTATALATCIA